MSINDLILYIMKLPLLPIGFISILLVEKNKHKTYMTRYILNLAIILTVASIYYYLHSYFKLSTLTNLSISLVIWITLNAIKLRYV